MTSPTTILLLGTDTRPGRGQRGLRHSDSIMLVRTDPDHHRLFYLSIPRDLWVDIPGYGSDRINTAYQIGGAPLALKTIKAFTGLDIDHVVIVDFQRFKELIDRIGGVDVYVPHAIHSNRFDCPLKPAKCATWTGWHFEKGTQHMNGRRALAYSRVRENQLDPADNDITRGERQQAVAQAITNKLAGVGTFLRLPFAGDDLLKPLATDLDAGDFLELGWVKFRADGGRVVRCRLGGDLESINGASVIRSSEDNRSVISMFTDQSAPQPPNPGRGEDFPPGCLVGVKRWRSANGSSRGALDAVIEDAGSLNSEELGAGTLQRSSSASWLVILSLWSPSAFFVSLFASAFSGFFRRRRFAASPSASRACGRRGRSPSSRSPCP